jgi:RimJ/RimL family protein N-acetyltransferase
MGEPPPVRLRNLAAGDLALYEAIHCDPAMMEHLGGPLPREGLGEKLRRDVATTEADETWVLVVLVGEDRAPAGTVSVWSHEGHGHPVEEIGWMILPAFQGRGIGTAVVRAVVDRARETGRWSELHAFPPVSNEGSNAMARRLGFTLVGTNDYEYRGHRLTCNDWMLDVGRRPDAG